jgi:DNA-binding helix-hairpin-helix protein with protein kinase domain
VILKRCKKNHFFDSNHFSRCPYCAIEKSGLEEDTQIDRISSKEKTESAKGKRTGA